MLVSIALPTYNGAKYLRRQLESIFQQTYPALEVIAVDDCSTDGTIDILEEFRAHFPLRYVVNERRLGFVKNFERAISLCEGTYVALADQDDMWVPQKLDILLSHLADRSVVCSDFSLIDEEGAILAHSFRRSLNIPIPNADAQFHCLAFINFVQGCTCLFRSSFKNSVLPIPIESMSHDWWIGIRATQFAGIAYVDQPLVMYRQHGTNTVGAKNLWKISGKLRYVFSGSRREGMEKERDRIRYYIDHGVYSNSEQRKFLDGLYQHYHSILNSRIHIRALTIAINNRHLLLPNISTFSRWVYLLGRLV